MSHQASTNLEEDPPYTPQFGASVSPFEFFDFTYDSRTDLRRHYATYQADWRPVTGGRFGDHQVTTALDWDGERGTLTDALAQTEVVARRDNVGWTLQHQALWPRLFATVSVRVEHNDSFGTATVPRVAAAFVARQSRGAVGETRLKASAGRGIKEPTIVESYSPDPFFLGNPELLPERSRSVDAGIEQRLAHDRLKIEATWFDGRFRDIISTRTLSFNPFRSQFFNIGETRARGLELARRRRPGRGRADPRRLHVHAVARDAEHVAGKRRVRRRPVALPPPAALRLRRSGVERRRNDRLADRHVRRAAGRQRFLVARAADHVE